MSNLEEGMRIKCSLCLCDLSLPDQMGDGWVLYAACAHLLTIHGYPDHFDLRATGDGAWTVEGREVIEVQDRPGRLKRWWQRRLRKPGHLDAIASVTTDEDGNKGLLVVGPMLREVHAR